MTCGDGLPSAIRFKMAVWLLLTVVSTGRCSRDGVEMDLPSSPFAPFAPGGPRGPKGRGSPGSPRSPFIPIGPWGPTGPCLPGAPSDPGLPGGPGFPRVPGLPRRPVLPFGPERQSVSSLAQIWFCNSWSSFLISIFTSATVWVDFCCDLSGEARFYLELGASEPRKIAKKLKAWLNRGSYKRIVKLKTRISYYSHWLKILWTKVHQSNLIFRGNQALQSISKSTGECSKRRKIASPPSPTHISLKPISNGMEQTILVSYRNIGFLHRFLPLRVILWIIFLYWLKISHAFRHKFDEKQNLGTISWCSWFLITTRV